MASRSLVCASQALNFWLPRAGPVPPCCWHSLPGGRARAKPPPPPRGLLWTTPRGPGTLWVGKIWGRGVRWGTGARGSTEPAPWPCRSASLPSPRPAWHPRPASPGTHCRSCWAARLRLLLSRARRRSRCCRRCCRSHSTAARALSTLCRSQSSSRWRSSSWSLWREATRHHLSPQRGPGNGPGEPASHCTDGETEALVGGGDPPHTIQVARPLPTLGRHRAREWAGCCSWLNTGTTWSLLEPSDATMSS